MKTVFEQLPPPLLLKETNTFNAALRLAQQLSTQLPLHFMKQALAVTAPQHLQTLVRNCHSSIQLITERLHQHTVQLRQLPIVEPVKEEYATSFAQLQTGCQQFFGLLQDHYGEHLQEQDTLPIACWQQEQPKMLETAKKLLRQTLHTGSESLVQAALNNLLPHLDPGARIPLHTFRYWQQLLPALLKQTRNASKEQSMELIYTLLRFNCNCEYILGAALPYMAATLPECETPQENLAQWQQLLKQVQHILPKPGLCLHTGLPDAKTQMIQYLEEEIAERRQRIPATGTDQPDKRLQFDLTVSQLALFMRLLVQTKVISVTSHDSFLKQVAEHFLIRKGAQPHIETLHVRYYTPRPNDQSLVKDMLMEMLHTLRSF